MSSIKVRVGQANAIKVLSSQAGGTLQAEQARNVVGGIASVTQLNVTGISTFVGIITAQSDVFFDGNLTVGGDINLDEITSRNLDVTGIATIASLGVSGVTTSQHLNIIGVSTLGTVSSLFVSGLSTFSNNVSFASSALFGDNDKLLFGDGNDLELYHNGTASYIDNNTGPLFIRNNVDNDDGGNIIIQAKSGKTSAVFQDDEGVRLYYNDIEKFITTDDGIIISGIASATSFQGANATAASFPRGINVTGVSTFNNVDVVFQGAAASQNITFDASENDLEFSDLARLKFGDNDDLEIWHGSGNDTHIKNSTNDLKIRSDSLILKREDDSEPYLKATVNEDVKLYYNGNEKFATTGIGVTVLGTLTAQLIDGGVF